MTQASWLRRPWRELLSIAFTQLTGVATRLQLPPEIAYEDEVNTFTLANNFADLRAPDFEALFRFHAGYRI